MEAPHKLYGADDLRPSFPCFGPRHEDRIFYVNSFYLVIESELLLDKSLRDDVDFPTKIEVNAS